MPSDLSKTTKLPRSVLTLGMRVVAEHPEGHRVVGEVVGVGSAGAILRSPSFNAGFLADADGWTFTAVENSNSAAPSEPERISANDEARA